MQAILISSKPIKHINMEYAIKNSKYDPHIKSDEESKLKNSCEVC